MTLFGLRRLSRECESYRGENRRGPFAISNIVDHAKSYSRSHDVVIRVYDAAGAVVETHEQAGDFKEF